MNTPVSEERSHWPISVLSSLASVINMLLPLFLVRVLSPEEIGAYKLFFLYLLIVPGLSMITGVTSGLAYWAGQRENRRAIQVSSLMILASGVVFTLAALALTKPLTAFIGWDVEHTVIFAIALFGTIAGGFFEEAAISMGRTWSGAISYAGFEIFRTSCIVTAAVISRDVITVLVVHTALITLKVIVTYLVGYRMGLVGFDFDRAVSRAVWSYAFPVSLAWVFGVFVERADQLILSTLISKTEFAFYAIGCLIVPPLFTLEHSITRVLIPQLSECFAARDDERASRLYSEAVENLAFLFFPAVTGLIVFARPIIEILFTKQYSSASQYLELYALTYLALVFPNDAVPRAKGQANWILKNFSAFSIFSLALAYVSTLEFGPFGALCAVIVSRAAMRYYGVYYIRRETGWRYGTFLPLGAMARILVTCGILAAASILALPFFSSAILWFVVCAPLFAVLYFPIVLWMEIKSERRRSAGARVMLLTPSLPIGGLERMVFDLARTLTKNGVWQPFVVAYDQSTEKIPTGFVPVLRREGIAVLLWQKPEGFSPRVVLRIILFLLRYDIRVIHSHHLGPLMYACVAKICLLGRLRIVHTQHSLLHLSEERKYTLYERLFSRLVDELVVVAPGMLPTYEKWGVQPEHLHVIINGVTAADHVITDRSEKMAARDALIESLADDGERASLSAHLKDIWLLYLARIHPVKGQRHAIEIWKNLSPEIRARAVLIFAGPEAYEGELFAVQKIAAAASDADRIRFIGGTKESHRWYAAADLFISCSEFEGLPLAPLEALSAGLPALLSDIPGHAFLRPQAELFALNNIPEGTQRLTAMIETVLNGSANKLALSRAEWVKKSYSVDRMAQQYTALYSAKPPKQ